jgi:hypothetical protein
VHTAVLKLPRPYPHAYSAPRDDGLNRSELTKPVPFANRYLYSDSDDEGSYTVTDHDVRLAYVPVADSRDVALKSWQKFTPAVCLALTSRR